MTSEPNSDSPQSRWPVLPLAPREPDRPARKASWPVLPIPHEGKPTFTAPDRQSGHLESGKPRSRGRVAMALLVVCAALVGGAVGGLVVNHARTGSVTISSVSASPEGATLPNGSSIPNLVHQVLPSIVSIDVRSGGSEDQGTGMIISGDGQVITNNHVIALAASGGSITVTRSGSTRVEPAKLIGTDPSNDVALLQIDGASNLHPVTFGNSSGLQVGDATVAIGNALGLAAGTPTVTQGIVSALGRTVTASNEVTNVPETLTNMIQTDAAINPGNSGGALLDSQGDVIGMNTAVAGAGSSGQSAQNIGFAIPASKIEYLLPGLEAGGVSTTKSSHGYLGVEIASVTPDLRTQYRLVPQHGAVVLSVVPGSPAATGGLLQGDVIVSLNGQPITSAEQVSGFTAQHHPGTSVVVGVYRGSRRLNLDVTLGTTSG